MFLFNKHRLSDDSAKRLIIITNGLTLTFVIVFGWDLATALLIFCLEYIVWAIIACIKLAHLGVIQKKYFLSIVHQIIFLITLLPFYGMALLMPLAFELDQNSELSDVLEVFQNTYIDPFVIAVFVGLLLTHLISTMRTYFARKEYKQWRFATIMLFFYPRLFILNMLGLILFSSMAESGTTMYIEICLLLALMILKTYADIFQYNREHRI